MGFSGDKMVGGRKPRRMETMRAVIGSELALKKAVGEERPCIHEFRINIVDRGGKAVGRRRRFRGKLVGYSDRE